MWSYYAMLRTFQMHLVQELCICTICSRFFAESNDMFWCFYAVLIRWYFGYLTRIIDGYGAEAWRWRGIYFSMSTWKWKKVWNTWICYSCMVWRLVWLVPVHCHIDKDTYSTPFPHLTTFCGYQTSQFWLQNREAGRKVTRDPITLKTLKWHLAMGRIWMLI